MRGAKKSSTRRTSYNTYREETAPKRDIFLTSPCTAVEGAGAASSVVASMVCGGVGCCLL